MPKDATKNIDRYKIRGGQLNEFDFNRNQEELAEASKPNADNFIPGTPPEQREGALPFLGKLTKKAGKAIKGTKITAAKANAAKSTKAKSTKAAKSAKAGAATKAAKASKARKNAPRGATAKKLAARKAAKK